MPIFLRAAMTWRRHAPSMRDNPAFLLAICMSAASNALAGRLEPAQKAMARALELNPDLRGPVAFQSRRWRDNGDLNMDLNFRRRARERRIAAEVANEPFWALKPPPAGVVVPYDNGP